MRKRDKIKNIEDANLMLEQYYLKSKGLLNEEESATPMNTFGPNIVKEYDLKYVTGMDNVTLTKEVKSKGLPQKGVLSIITSMGHAVIYIVTKEKQTALDIFNKFKKEYPKNIHDIQKQVNIGGEEQIWLIEFTILNFDKL